jgi:hypothetical protein
VRHGAYLEAAVSGGAFEMAALSSLDTVSFEGTRKLKIEG